MPVASAVPSRLCQALETKLACQRDQVAEVCAAAVAKRRLEVNFGAMVQRCVLRPVAVWLGGVRWQFVALDRRDLQPGGHLDAPRRGAARRTRRPPQGRQIHHEPSACGAAAAASARCRFGRWLGGAAAVPLGTGPLRGPGQQVHAARAFARRYLRLAGSQRLEPRARQEAAIELAPCWRQQLHHHVYRRAEIWEAHACAVRRDFGGCPLFCRRERAQASDGLGSLGRAGALEGAARQVPAVLQPAGERMAGPAPRRNAHLLDVHAEPLRERGRRGAVHAEVRGAGRPGAGRRRAAEVAGGPQARGLSRAGASHLAPRLRHRGLHPRGLREAGCACKRRGRSRRGAAAAQPGAAAAQPGLGTGRGCRQVALGSGGAIWPSARLRAAWVVVLLG
mmetsp:Transcript_170179/g.545755  ORF Transcript_170179/g.545755 Transcript_170179/m.545755 type:complete len:393 (+) Transcript_170179:341-1519(+)